MKLVKNLLVLLVLLCAHSVWAGTEVNHANGAALQSIKGVGPALSKKIVAERAKGAFADWADFIERVHGVGAHTATKLSQAGLTVNGVGYVEGEHVVVKTNQRRALHRGR